MKAYKPRENLFPGDLAHARCLSLSSYYVPFGSGGIMREYDQGYRGVETTGFQSPAQDHIEPVIDLAAMLDLRRPQDTHDTLTGSRNGCNRRRGDHAQQPKVISKRP